MNSYIFGGQDIWESDDEYEINEISPPDIDEHFRDNMLNIKHKLYEKIINESEDSENNLKKYISKLNKLYIMSIEAQTNKKILQQNLSEFPSELKEQIQSILTWISDYFSKNNIPDTIPYTDYIKKSLHDYQFIQHNSFE